jgi:HEAT repeat protein
VRGRLSIGILLLLAVAALVAAGFSRRPPALTRPARELRTRMSDFAAERAAAVDPRTAKLLKAMAHPTADAAVQAREALTRHGKAVVPLLTPGLRSPDPHMRAAAALVLGNIADPRALRPLTEALEDPDQRVRYRAAYALGRLGDPRAASRLAPRLLDPSPHVATIAIRALEECGARVRLGESGSGYQVLCQGEASWRVVAP